VKPPSHLDSAKVLYWAWSGDKPFGTMEYVDGRIAAEIFGFAICLLAGTLFRFSCDRQWEVQNDMDFPSIQEAMDFSYPQYQNQSVWRDKFGDIDISSLLFENDYPQHRNRPVVWNKFDDTDIDALLYENQRVRFYQEVGGRRVIQKIVTHLNKHNCNGMGVYSIAEGVWELSILRKDIPIASEIAERNID
jgi:hypothetical protein